MMRTTFGAALRAATALGVLALGACVGDGDELITGGTEAARGGALFSRYVSLGNSITAGFQSGGINDSLQRQAYPVLLANRAIATFNSPLIARPGCPRPFLAPLGATGRLGTADSCFRINNPTFINNLAVPGERIGDLVTLTSDPALSQLHTILIGPRTQVQAMLDTDPTLVSVWIGNNDALAAALSGTLGATTAGGDSLLTPLASFRSSLDQVVSAVDEVIDAEPNREDAILIGVVNAIAAAPLIQPGAYFFLAAQGTGGSFNGKPVNPNCSPVTPLGQPNPLSFNLVSFQIVSDGRFPEINCDPNAYSSGDPRRGAFLLDTSEQAVVTARINAYNAAISAAASSKGWIYMDPNALLAPFLNYTRGTRNNFLRKCQGLRTSTSLLEFRQAIVESCPVPPQQGGAPNFFGSLMSFDGVHPSAAAHVVIANELARLINAKHSLSLPTQ